MIIADVSLAHNRQVDDQRGDTLVEVTLALAILISVLLGATTIAVRAFNISRTAQERTHIANEAQAQMETLRAFRDNHTWSEFLHGLSGIYAGVLNSASYSCTVTPGFSGPCFHMGSAVVNSRQEFVPFAGRIAGSVPTSFIEIAASPEASGTPQFVDIVIAYGFEREGGGVLNYGHLKTRLVNSSTP